MIRREWHTKRECAELMIDDMLIGIDSSWLIDNDPEWYEHWNFRGRYYMDDDDECIGEVGRPMWNWWWIIKDCWLDDFIAEHEDEVIALGFVIIKDEDFNNFALGIDGAGYSFFEHHWIPLYELLGFEWHDEEDVNETE